MSIKTTNRNVHVNGNVHVNTGRVSRRIHTNYHRRGDDTMATFGTAKAGIVGVVFSQVCLRRWPVLDKY